MLGWKIAVGEVSADERGEDGCQREKAVDESRLKARKIQIIHEVSGKNGSPGTPNRILKEHHCTKTEFDAHNTSFV